jgi:hypothetical protein
MRNTIFAFLGFLLITSFSYAQEKNEKENYLKKKPSYVTTYVNMGAQALPNNDKYILAPSITGGLQFKEKRQAVDVSVSYAEGKEKLSEDNSKETTKAIALTLPKVQYQTYIANVNSKVRHNAFFGLGAAVNYNESSKETVVENQKDEENRVKSTEAEFAGIAANAAVGYIYKLGKNLQSSVKLGASVPTPLYVRSKGEIYKPSFELNVGLGF